MYNKEEDEDNGTKGDNQGHGNTGLPDLWKGGNILAHVECEGAKGWKENILDKRLRNLVELIGRPT
jgi:hypothetical protein